MASKRKVGYIYIYIYYMKCCGCGLKRFRLTTSTNDGKVMKLNVSDQEDHFLNHKGVQNTTKVMKQKSINQKTKVL